MVIRKKCLKKQTDTAGEYMEDSRGQASWLWYPHMNSLTSLVSQAETSEQTTFVRELQGCATPSYLTPVQIRRMGRREAADEMARAVEGRAWRVLALLGVCVRLSGPGSRSVTLPPIWREVGKVEAKNELTRKLLEKLLQRRGRGDEGFIQAGAMGTEK